MQLLDTVYFEEAMRKNKNLELLISILLAFVLGCSNSSEISNKTSIPTKGDSPATTPSPEFSPEKGKEEKSFTFVVQGGKKITAYVYPGNEKPNGKMIVFAPFLERTDGNLYNAALNSLWSVYGKKRGVFQLSDAKTGFDSSLGGNAICWGIFNPAEEFCVFPIKDSGTGALRVLRVWVK